MYETELDIKKAMRSKRIKAQTVIGTATTLGVVMGAIPIPFSDAILLNKAENMELNSIASIYGIEKNDKSRAFMDTIVQIGTASTVIKSAASALKAIPGLNLGTSIINAIIAGSIVALIGECAIFAFEQVCLGKKTINDLDWLRKVVESKFTKKFINSIYTAFGQISNNADKEEIVEIIKDTFFSNEE